MDLADGCACSNWDGWAHLAAVLDCQNYCECISYEFAFRGRAQEGERDAEVACLKRFGTLRPSVPHKHPNLDWSLRVRSAYKSPRWRQNLSQA